MTRTGRVRAFFAVALEGEARETLARAASSLAAEPWGDGIRWAARESLHMTLRFLGDVEREATAGLLEAVREAVSDAPAFACRLEGIAGFPNASRTRVVAASLSPEEPIAAIQRRVEAAVVASGFEPEKRRFRAHVTLGRVRRPPLRGVVIDVPLAPVAVPVDRIVLFRSELSSDGARYSALGEARLA